MISYVKKLIREVIGDPHTPEECLESLRRLARTELPQDLTPVDRQWLALWFEELLTHAQGAAGFHDAFPDGQVPAL